jgi:hypothetical protein
MAYSITMNFHDRFMINENSTKIDIRRVSTVLHLKYSLNLPFLNQFSMTPKRNIGEYRRAHSYQLMVGPFAANFGSP